VKLELRILEYLNNNDDGKFVDITFIDENYFDLKDKIEELKEKNLVLIDDYQRRDFESFGISNQRKKSINAKIKMNGKIYLHSLNKINQLKANALKRKRSWKFASLFNF
jgi:hypothetical protein